MSQSLLGTVVCGWISVCVAVLFLGMMVIKADRHSRTFCIGVGEGDGLLKNIKIFMPPFPCSNGQGCHGYLR